MDNDAFDDRYELRRFTPGLTEDGTAVDAANVAFMDAMSMGFHEAREKPEALLRSMRAGMAEDRWHVGVYRTQPAPGSVDETQPAGTFVWFRKALSWGDGTAIDTMAIAGVTVRATERRRGVLRRMMTTSLTDAAHDGYALAALTASESSIYRRFGFGPAIRERVVRVQRAGSLPFLVETVGEVSVVEPTSLEDGLAREVFDRFHARTPGSMVRNETSWMRLLGRDADGEPDRNVRAAVVRAPGSDAVDGYVTYRMVEESPMTGRLDVIDLVYATDEAYLALWEYLLSVDLNKSVRYDAARIDDPLVHVLQSTRSLDIDHEEDHVWLRVLDPVRVLESRPFAADGALTFAVTDALGFAAGAYRLTVLEGRGRVERIGDGPSDGGVGTGPGVADGTGTDLSFDVAELGAVLLGAVDPVSLAAAGLVHGDPAAARLLRTMLAPARTPHGISYF